MYPEHSQEFSVGNAACYIFAATVSLNVGGWLSDKYEDSQPLAKSWICAGSTALALPFITLCLTRQDDFYFSFGMMWIHYLFSGGWDSSSLVMLQNTTSTRNQGFIIGLYNLLLSLFALISTVVLGRIQMTVDAPANPE